MNTPLPASLFRLFWDTTPENIDIQKHGKYVVSRLFEHGDIDAVRWALRTYPRDSILDWLAKSKQVSKRTQSFWIDYLRNHASQRPS